MKRASEIGRFYLRGVLVVITIIGIRWRCCSRRCRRPAKRPADAMQQQPQADCPGLSAARTIQGCLPTGGWGSIGRATRITAFGKATRRLAYSVLPYMSSWNNLFIMGIRERDWLSADETTPTPVRGFNCPTGRQPSPIHYIGDKSFKQLPAADRPCSSAGATTPPTAGTVRTLGGVGPEVIMGSAATPFIR